MVVLDADGLAKAAALNAHVLGFLHNAAMEGNDIIVSTITLVETLRGVARDAAVNLMLKGISVVPVSEEIAREAAALFGRTGRADTVDAVVAVTAGRSGTSVRLLTSDPDDLRALTADMPHVRVHQV